jgi:predicted esterase
MLAPLLRRLAPVLLATLAVATPTAAAAKPAKAAHAATAAAPRVAKTAAKPSLDPQHLDVPGTAGAYFVPPRGKGLRPVVMYLHGRGGNPEEDCKKWAKVASAYGWVVCPAGPEDRGGGSRGWASSPDAAQKVMDASIAALRGKYKGRVQTRNNILVGFSEGAFIAQQVGLKDPQKWSKWLILAASDKYWLGTSDKDLAAARAKIRRVYLLTGETDGVVENTKSVGKMLQKAHVPVKVNIVKGMGHEVPSDKMVANYKKPLAWLSTGK